VQFEPWLERDRVMIDQLRTVGITRGQPFTPDPRTQELLEAAVSEARAWLDAGYAAVFRPYYEGGHWALPADPELIESVGRSFQVPDTYPVDARGVTYSFAFFSAKHLGSGQFYLMTITDQDGNPLDGATAYRLRVPADAPVTQYWSATAYDRRTHTFIRNAPRLGRSSKARGCWPTLMVRWTCCSAPRLPRARKPTGFPPAPMDSSRSCSASTVPKNHCSTRPGSSPTSPCRPDAQRPAIWQSSVSGAVVVERPVELLLSHPDWKPVMLGWGFLWVDPVIPPAISRQVWNVLAGRAR